MKFFLSVLAILFVLSSHSEAGDRSQINYEQHHCLATALYFEARNQTDRAMRAVGYVITNRVESDRFPDTICRVVKQGTLAGGPPRLHRCQFSFYCDGLPDRAPVSDNRLEHIAWDRSKVIASEVMTLPEKYNPVGNSTYYHATSVDPFWSDDFSLVRKLGDHLFYKR